MDLLARIQHHFATSIATQQQALAVAGPAIALAAERIAHCLTYEGEVHILVIHCLCDRVDQLLFGEDH